MPARRKHPERYRSLAHFFGARVRDLRDSYEERVGSPLRLTDFASRTGYSVSMIGGIERGDHLPDGGDRVRALDEVLAAGGELVCLWPLVQRLGRQPIDELIAAADSGNNGNGIPQCQDDDVERRILFRLTGLGLLTTSPALTDAEALRQLIEKTLGTAESFSAEDWEAAIAEHRHTLRTRPPAEARESLASDLMTLQWSLAQAKAEQKADLQRSAALLAFLYSDVLTRLGEFGASRRWWATARRAADASGDLDLRVRTRGKEAVFALYTPRSPDSVIRLSRESQNLARGMVSTSSLQALAGETQALALMGRDREAREALGRLHTLADKVGERSDLGWSPDSVWFVTSWVHSYGGSSKEAAKAREEAMKRTPAYQNAANLRLHEAITVAREGGHDEAMRLAADTVSGLAPAYRSHMILHTARQVQELVPPARRRGTAFDDYRSAVLSSSL
jgi:transcriptional regulator with XRE-family HTH domain